MPTVDIAHAKRTHKHVKRVEYLGTAKLHRVSPGPSGFF